MVSGPALLLGELSAQLTERLTSPALRATSPMRRGFGAPRYHNRNSLIMPEAGSPRASPYNRSQAINLSRPAALCVGAVPRPFWPVRCRPTEGAERLPKRTAVAGQPVARFHQSPFWHCHKLWLFTGFSAGRLVQDVPCEIAYRR